MTTRIWLNKCWIARNKLKVALDGGFASKDNLSKAKERKIKDVCFAKKRGLKETDMCRSHYVYKKLRRFRAGIEAGISWLKRQLLNALLFHSILMILGL